MGTSSKIEYHFDLDIKAENKDRENRERAAEQKEKNRNPLFLVYDKYALHKLKAAIFLIDFPLNFLIRIMDVWQKSIPTDDRPS